ncbi:hypothetical protein C8J57DRAFT_1490757 [Mycena rebaudengoi]|nr:hypothetical protein C8J57DRAFT_1490757 [Mycena rebaudengoi]
MPASIASTNLNTRVLPKRLLFPAWPTNDLPPLFANPNTPPELTAELYDFIALALRAFVNPWWTKISRYDKDFLPDITRILTHVVRALETRVQEHDLAPLVFRDLSTSYASGGALSLPVLFHGLQPHMAVTADGDIDPQYMRQIIDQILRSCLPQEDYEPETERFIIREIVLKILLKDVIPKITQPWFIQKTILDLLGQDEEVILTKSRAPSPPAASTFSFHTLIVFLLSAVQALSGVCLALLQTYRQAVNTIKRVNQAPPPRPPCVSSPFLSPPTSPTPMSTSAPISRTSSISSWTPSETPPLQPAPAPPPDAPHDYALPPLELLSEIFTTPARMASCLHNPHRRPPPRLLLPLPRPALSPKLLLTTTRNAKRTLFPNGYPAPPPVDPTPEEQAQMRARLLAYRGRSPFVEAHLLPLLLGADPSATLAAALDPLTSRECNVHLVVLLLDRVIGTLFPELLGD